MKSKKDILKELQHIPGVGKQISQDLYNLGIRSIKDLKKQDPESLYQKLCCIQQKVIDRCMLYVLRCAVYYASTNNHDPEKLKWWHWGDK